MAAFEVIALDTATPQLRAPGASDTYTFPRAVEMPLGTANGVLFLNGSKVVTSGSALTFDGTDLAVGNAGGLALFKRASDGLSVGRIGSRSGTDISVYNAGGVTAEFVAGANELRFNVAGSERMRLDSSGNLGLGVTPSAWATNSRALQLKSYSAVFEDVVGRTTIGFNAYESASNVFTRIQTEASSLYRQVSGSHSWLTASSGAAGTTISFTQAMTLDASGRLMIGTTSPISTLTVAGQITISGSPGGLGGSVRYIGVGGTATDWFINVPAGGSHNFAINESTKVTFNSNGDYVFGNAAIATNATNGFLYVPSCAGTPTGTPTTYTGRVPIVVDTTNNKLYFYSGGAWRDAGP